MRISTCTDVKVCGLAIDEYQYTNYGGLCPDCVRSVKTSSEPSSLQLGRLVNLQQSIETRENVGGTLFFIGCSGIGVPLLLSMFMGNFGGTDSPFPLILPLIFIFGVGMLIIGALIYQSAGSLKEELRRL